MVHLSRSQIFKDYERAFSEATGLPLNIRGHDSWSPAHHGKTDHVSFAAILARFNKARAACLRAQTDASQELVIDDAHRHLVCGTLRKRSAGVCR